MAQAAHTARASTADSEFDRDTSVTLREPGVYDADLSEGWAILSAVNGGYLLAIVARALRDALSHPDPFTVTAHYLTPSKPGPAVVRTETVRTGRSLATGQASLFQYEADGTEVERVRVMAAYGSLDSLGDDVRTSVKPPALPPSEHCLGTEDGPAAFPDDSGFARRVLIRLDPATAGWAIGAPSGKGEMRGWFSLADGREPDPLSLLLTVDAFPPTAFDLGLMGWTPTVELTTHIRCRPAPGPLRVFVTTRNLAGGYLEEDADVWDSADRLVAQARQLARAPREARVPGAR
ncbi:thioesterase family protein [Streptomyces sp. NBC_01716]|uniref:thioesterase family protein n=1 Tax=Streptomyces sp. NBC_01716 TaxID=2975917 RepID=UPI002E30C3B3|nr:thioesterase family protein [Streptomyces sp. NBC_01716]